MLHTRRCEGPTVTAPGRLGPPPGAAYTARPADVFDPSFVSSVGALGPLGFAIIAIGAFAFRWVITRGEFANLERDRDDWKALANGALDKVDRLSDAFEGYLRTKP